MLSKLIMMREQLVLYLGIEAKTRSQIYLAKANAHTQNKGSQTECVSWELNLVSELVGKVAGWGRFANHQGRKNVWWWLLCEFLLAPPSLISSSLTSIISIQHPAPTPFCGLEWNLGRRRRRRKDGIGALRTKMNMYVESCHGKKGMYLVRHKRQAKDEEETKFCAKKWRTYLTTT